MKAFLLAAGLGTRLKPFTDNHPKALAEVSGKTLLERNIEKLQKFGVNEFIINIHHFGEQIIDFLEKNDGFGSRYIISDEREELLDTGGGLLKVKELIGQAENILMMNVDILSNIDLKALIHYHLLRTPMATLAVQDRPSSRKLLFEDSDRDELKLAGWKNEQTGAVKSVLANDEILPSWKERAFSGIQIINTKLFENIPFTGKFSIIDVYLHAMKQHDIIAFDHSGDIMIDVGKPESIQEAQKLFS